MENDRLQTRSLFASGSFWTAIMAWRLPWLEAKYGLDPSVAGQTTIAGIALRKMPSQPLHLRKPKE